MAIKMDESAKGKRKIIAKVDPYSNWRYNETLVTFHIPNERIGPLDEKRIFEDCVKALKEALPEVKL